MTIKTIIMKKFMLVMVAAVLAITFSAFTGAEKSVPPYFWYDEQAEEFVEYEGLQACPEGGAINCIVSDIEDVGDKQLYLTENFSQPLKYN